MTDRLYAKYIWLISTIHDAGKISFKDIACKWDGAYINDLHQPLKLRTFHNHRNAILMQFGIVIECQRDSNLYYIGNPDALENDSINQWLLDSFAVSNLLMDNRSISDRIMLEDVPSGKYYLEIITSAMRENRQIVIDYEDFFGNTIQGLKVNPYFIRLFKRRWYVMALVMPGKEIHRFGLDRIKRIEVLNSKFSYPKDFSPLDYYIDYYGVFHDVKPIIIRLKAYREKPNYLRSLPLHHSQREIESNADYTIFEYKIAPTYDFIQEILSHGNQLEVLSPDAFRQQIKAIIQEMHDFYK
ncbi:WYL domain-containing protein [Segatella bryantii]|jgi:predicted DNA-binding transcriptional regulator YafY|uniref:WYL domain-containing protein n=1 Tax=Segatella bryantii TaxID=77095 RepID=UPI00088CFC81|nr:WYL domain-containing protein [Segatella bryantii]SDL87545.1 WYL domain-containing protein [Segatella bryantii]